MDEKDMMVKVTAATVQSEVSAVYGEARSRSKKQNEKPLLLQVVVEGVVERTAAAL